MKLRDEIESDFSRCRNAHGALYSGNGGQCFEGSRSLHIPRP
jgi:hypothetical protein